MLHTVVERKSEVTDTQTLRISLEWSLEINWCIDVTYCGRASLEINWSIDVIDIIVKQKYYNKQVHRC